MIPIRIIFLILHNSSKLVLSRKANITEKTFCFHKKFFVIGVQKKNCVKIFDFNEIFATQM